MVHDPDQGIVINQKFVSHIIKEKRYRKAGQWIEGTYIQFTEKNGNGTKIIRSRRKKLFFSGQCFKKMDEFIMKYRNWKCLRQEKTYISKNYHNRYVNN